MQVAIVHITKSYITLWSVSLKHHPLAQQTPIKDLISTREKHRKDISAVDIWLYACTQGGNYTQDIKLL